MLVGREHEQQAIDRLVAGARIGASGVLAVTGEAGRRQDRAARRLRPRVASTACGCCARPAPSPSGRSRSPGCSQLLRPALGLLDAIAAAAGRGAVGGPGAAPDGPGRDRFAIGAATLSLLCRYAEEAPVAVLVDDVHLLDRAVGQRAGLRRPPAELPTRSRCSWWVGPARPTTSSRASTGWSSAGLDLGAARSLVDGLSATPVTDAWLARVHALTGGNPLAIAELAEDPDALLPTGSDVPPPLSSAPRRVLHPSGAPARSRLPGRCCSWRSCATATCG